MRVTESRMMELSAAGMASARDRAAQAEQVMSSGVRVAQPSDDPVAWQEGERAAARTAMSQARGTAIGTATDHLQQTDTALSTIADALQSARSLAVEGANGALGPNEVAALASSVSALRDTVLAQANARDTDGEYLFAGSRGTTAPFSAAGAYSGDAATRSIELAEGQTAPVTVSGAALTSASGVDVLGVLSSLATALQGNNVAGIQQAIGDLKTATDQVSGARAQAGAALGELRSADNARGQLELTLNTLQSRDVDADPITAASNLAQAKAALDASQAVAQEIAAMMQTPRG